MREGSLPHEERDKWKVECDSHLSLTQKKSPFVIEKEREG
jgi:hypothetical protein